MQRQCVWFDAPYQVCVRDEAVSTVASNQVLVQTIVSAISAGTELLFYRGQVPNNLTVDAAIAALAGETRYPLRYGYACVGRVIEIGAQVDASWQNRLVFSFQPHASYFVACIDELIAVPDGIAPQQAAFLPNMESAVNFVMDGAPVIGERIVVLGQGVVGLLTTAVLAQMPLETLVTFDRFALRREKSRALGAHNSLDPSNAGEIHGVQSTSADLMYELTGNPEALNLAIDLTGFAGRIVVGSWYGEKRAAIDLGGKFHRSRIRMISSQVSSLAPELSARWSKARRMDVAWSMLARLRLSELVTHRFKLADAARAYELLNNQPEQALQVLFEYEH